MLDQNQNSTNIPKKIPNHNPVSAIRPTKPLLSIYRAKVIDAYRNRKIFTVFGNCNTIRRALLKRGWLEKLSPNQHTKLQSLPEEILLQNVKQGNDYEAVVISKIIKHFPSFFVWQQKVQRDLYTDVNPYRNRIRRDQTVDFSTKVGLIGCAEQQQWFQQEGVSGMLYPRFFRLGDNQEEQMAFKDDFRLTQCHSLIRYLIRHQDKPEDIIDFENGNISSTVIQFALTRAQCQLDRWDNVSSMDIEQNEILEDEWFDFLMDSSKAINQHNKIKCSYRELMDFTKTGNILLNRIQDRRPDLKWDGYKNLWILKPGFQCRGLGIIIRNNLDDILQWSLTHLKSRYIVQKYIEYNIDDLREVIHLTNNSVQKKYKITTTRDVRLPKSNMWSLDQFKVFIKSQNLPEDTWESRVFSGFCENLNAVVLSSLDDTNLCENSFELYGCDFMLDEQYNPILIEINSSPDLTPSTDVTARICPMVLKDCIKVIVDLPQNSRASTGLFKMVYEVNYKFKKDFDAKEGLYVNGKSMELLKRACISVRPKLFKKAKKIERNNNTQQQQSSAIYREKKTTPTLVNCSKSKTCLSKSVPKSLKTVTKEALALRYTMPK